MNRLLVTGLSLGRDFDTCLACGLDLEWLLQYPSILVWSDSILIPKSIWQDASSGGFRHRGKHPELGKCIQIIFEQLKGKGLIEVVDPQSVINPTISSEISEQVRNDRIQLSELFPEVISLGDEERVPGELFVNGIEYCHPHMWTIYASFVLAKAWDAHCLFNSRTMSISRYKFGLSNMPPHLDVGRVESFQSIFEAYLPNDSIFPEYVLANKQTLCTKCVNEDNCRDTYLSQLERNLESVLAWRDYDEVAQMKSVISNIVMRRSESGGIIDASDIRAEFIDIQNRLRRRIQLVFPRIQRWSNISTIASIPIALAGVATGSALLTITGGSLLGLAQAASKTTDYLTSKYSWIAFTNKAVELSSR